MGALRIGAVSPTDLDQGVEIIESDPPLRAGNKKHGGPVTLPSNLSEPDSI